jgi:preprotein translocase subunit SecG
LYTLVLVIHLIVCFFLIFIVLIQSSKGAEMGAAFGGGSSQTLFGSRGAGTILTKLTTISAIVFMLTSLSLAILSISKGSIMMNTPKTEIPATPFEGTSQGPLQGEPGIPVEGDAAEAPAVPAAAAPAEAPVVPAE